MTFGGKLSKLRSEKNLTQDEVAKEVGISRRAYIAYEKDDVRPRNRETYRKIAKVLDCDINYLLVDEESALIGATAAISAFGVAISATAAPVGAIVALGTLLAVKKGFKKSKNNGVLSYNNDSLLQYERHQKKFRVTAIGIIYSELVTKGVSFQPDHTRFVDTLVSKPDERILILGQSISNWWLSFWSKDKELDNRVIISTSDRANVLFCRYVSAPADQARKASIVVDDNELFEALCAFKGNNSYRGNMSVILIDTENVKVVKEENIATYYENKEELDTFRIV